MKITSIELDPQCSTADIPLLVLNSLSDFIYSSKVAAIWQKGSTAYKLKPS